MNSRLIQIAEGRIRVLLPEVVFSEDKLKGVVLPDKTVSLEFSVSSENRVPVHLFFSSTNPRVSIQKELSVREFGKVSLWIDSKGLSISDEIRGSIDVLYNGGERSIPFVFSVGAKSGQRTPSFKTIDEFSRFAVERKEEAAALFSLKEFLLLPFMKDLHLQGLYRVYSNEADAMHGLSEFLKAAGYPVPGVEEAGDDGPSMKEKLCRGESSPKSREAGFKYRLLSAFLRYETALHREEGLSEAEDEISRLAATYPDRALSSLLLSYSYLQDQKFVQAKELLIRIQDGIQKQRAEKKAEYALFLYLASIVQGEEERIQNASKLIRKYYEETPTSLLLSMLEYRINHDPDRDPKEAAEFLRQCWFRGLKYTPVLESTALLYRETGEEPGAFTEYELLSVIYGLRHGLFDERKLFSLLSGKELNDTGFLNLYLTVLKTGYRLFGNKEFLLAVINILLRRKMTGKPYFYWFSEAVRLEMTVQGIYEGYMLSLPDGFLGALPENLVSYFGYHKEAYGIDTAFLYSNVLTEYAGREDIQDLYRGKIREFAIRSMKDERYSVAMKPIYRTILRKEFVNEETAMAMYRLFSLFEVTTSVPGARRIIIYYPELDDEDIYPIEPGNEALVPVFSEEAIPAVEDRKGKRFHDESLRMVRCFKAEELEKQCLLYTGNSLFMRLRETNEIVKRGVLRKDELLTVSEIIRDKRISPLYRTKLFEALIDLSEVPSMERLDCTDFLAEAEYPAFTKDYRLKLVNLFLRANRDALAVERALTYGIEGLSDDALLKITECALQDPKFTETDLLLQLAFLLFSHDSASGRVLEYLSRHYLGPVKEMTAILKAVRKKKAGAFDLAERTLIAGFFTGETRDLDYAFEFYLNDGARFDQVEKAFLVLRAHEFVTERRKMSESVIRELKKYVFSLPTVALIALIEQMASEEGVPDKEDRKLLTPMLLKCVEKNIVLSCFKVFEAEKLLPFELENRVFVEFRSRTAGKVSVIGKTFPNQKPFHREMNEIYPGIFVQSFFLYAREWIEYSFLTVDENGVMSEAEGGVLAREEGVWNRGGRYDELMTLEKKLRDNDRKATSDYLKNMLEKEAMIEDIFGK